MAADGTAYGYNNNRSVERLNQMLDVSLEAFRANPPKRVEIPESELKAEWCHRPDPGTSVLRIFTRIRPVPEGADPSNKIVARDHIWVTEDEVRAIFAGRAAEFSPPQTLVWRLARFHLTDNVRGEPDMWAIPEVREADFVVRPTNSGSYKMTGRFSASTADGRRGLQGKLTAEFTLDRRSAKVLRFRGCFEGEAWGASTYTQGAPIGRFPIVMAIVEVSDPTSKTVPPQAIFFGNEYLNPIPKQ
jgi:hypothetical protein